MFPRHKFEFLGFDVNDHGVQPDDYFKKTIGYLESAEPSAQWHKKLALISEKDSWPYEDASFHIVVSNQVLEHVVDHDFFFGEISRVLVRNGFGIHIFPTKHCLVEPHLRIPLAHRIQNTNLIHSLIVAFTTLGFGIYRHMKKSDPGLTVQEFAQVHADFLVRFTNFKFEKELHATAKRSRLHSSFKYTPQYYVARLRGLLGLEPVRILKGRFGIMSSLSSLVCRYIASSTMVVYQRQDYGRPIIRNEK
jgi:SAM-dependent methyltransferase